MRREGKFGLSRTIRHCCAGRLHPNPGYPVAGPPLWRRRAREVATFERRRQRYQELKNLASAFAAWKQAARVLGEGKWSGKANPWNRCCGGSGRTSGTGRAKLCVGHNYKHIARCPMCRQGGSVKSLKNVQGTSERQSWRALLREVRTFDFEALASWMQQSEAKVYPAIRVQPSRRAKPNAAPAVGSTHTKSDHGGKAPLKKVDSSKTDSATPRPEEQRSEWQLVEGPASWVDRTSGMVMVPPPPQQVCRAEACPCLGRTSKKRGKKVLLLWA